MDESNPTKRDSLRRSVVKVFTTIKQPDYFQPWSHRYQTNSGGSACVLENQRILTNAHVVSDQVYVQLLKPGDSKKYAAQVEYVDHDSELALLKVDDEKFFEGTAPVSFGELPNRQAKVAVYGFPVGGNELCVTEGVVSRIEVRKYTHSLRSLLSLQTDAAINPGNSGGPVFMDGRLVGVAFQSHKKEQVERSGYIVPIPIIRHFLDDIEDANIGGVPSLGAYWQKIENECLRDYLQLAADKSGVLVTRVIFGSSSYEVLEDGDVITKIEDVPVACDGSILLREDDRVHFSYLVSKKQVGEKIALEILRAGKTMQVAVTLKRPTALVPGPVHDRRPTYFIFGGLVFMPLTYKYMTCWEWKEIDPRLRHYWRDALPSERRKEVVIINQVLAHDVNAGYHQVRGAIVDRINGVRITEMKDVPAALKTTAQGGKYHVIEIDFHAGHGGESDYSSAFGTKIVLDANAAVAATEKILSTYGISADRSGDLI